ncbi:hypothetical protein D9619_001231 [Psilocybe cf. subviscida]|uniref:Uncharacterized protein n=1 Tax=Psilocybe cf. subviscida TaxID=2480587 RepID=A0A8H5F336_9AGAR|nr:hypothetical protein D9619_001231 [Psilocybe cf. subviscida]
MAAPTSLPDDIIQLILDEVANSRDLPTLRACAVVSWAVNIHARKHLYSDIQFSLDSSANKRAKRLVHLLRNPRNQDLHTRIRSLTIIIGDAPSEGTRAVIQKSKTSLRKAVANFMSPAVDYVSILFQLFASIPLTAFTLKPRFNTEDLESSQTVIVHWSTLCGKMPAGLLSGLIHGIACNPCLQSLTFRWIWGMPVTLLIGSDISRPLRKLNIHRSSFTSPWETISDDDLRKFSTRVSDLRVLTLIAQGPILQLILPLTYPNLTTMIVNIPSQPDELSRLLQLLTSTSGTLASLTVQNLASFGSNFTSLSADYLSDFSSLEHLKYTTKAVEATQMLTRIDDISKLLLSARKPIGLKTITIHFQIYCSRLQTWIWNMLVHSRLPETSDAELNNRWENLDSALSNQNFGHLAKIRIHFTLFMYHSTNFPQYAQPSFELVLPEIYSHPSISVEVTTERICGSSAHEMWALGSDEGQEDDENLL